MERENLFAFLGNYKRKFGNNWNGEVENLSSAVLMSDEKYMTRSCPSCLREIPSFWDSCQFCGNVFRKSEPANDEPGMLCWGKAKKPK